jgi:DNA-binding HxlR family transcriptional regulator
MATSVRYRPSRVAPPRNECPLTECMAFLGGAWTPNVIWYLREGPRRFNELRGDVAGISAKVLSQRLQRLQADGIVDRRVMPTAPPTVEYELTELGRELLPAVDAIVEVGHRLKQRRSTNGSN